MKFLHFKNAIHFGWPGSQQREVDDASWTRWVNYADLHHAVRSGRPLAHDLVHALRRELLLVLALVLVQAALSLVAAILLRTLLQLISDQSVPDIKVIGCGLAVLSCTLVAWLVLNHIFYLAEATGVAARSYVERRILLAYGSDGRHPNLTGSIASTIDREGSRIESTWCGLVMIVLAFFTLVVTATFFFIALGVGAVLSLLVVTLASVIISRIAVHLSRRFEAISHASKARVQVGEYILRNRVSIRLNGWDKELLSSYENARSLEALAVTAVARLVAWINVITTITPISALLGAAFCQLWLIGAVDVNGILAAIALMGSLRSVANGVPDAIENLSQGRVAHSLIGSLLDINVSPGVKSCPIARERLHVAIVGPGSSGRTSFLLEAARESTHEIVFLSLSEPWIFSGSVSDNLTLGNPACTPDALSSVLELVRLSPKIVWSLDGAEQMIDHNGHGVSRGQATRIELGRAVLSGASDIYLDQPTMGLDHQGSLGLLADLLAGPWRDTPVMYVSDKAHEISLADEVWQMSDYKITARSRQAPLRQPEREGSVLNGTESPELAAQHRPSIAPSITRVETSVLQKLQRLHLFKALLVVVGLIALRETCVILGDYVMTHGMWNGGLGPTVAALFTLGVGAALLSFCAAMFGIRTIVRSATDVCMQYIQWGLYAKPAVGEDATARAAGLTREQRRIDEALPGVLIELIGALMILTSVVVFASATTYLIVAPFVCLAVMFIYVDRLAYTGLERANKEEIDASAAFLQRASEAGASAARLSIGTLRKGVANWMRPVAMRRARASMHNIRMRRWIGWRIDLIGLSGFAIIICGALYSHLIGQVLPTTGLGLSLAYGVISIYGRSSRTLVKLRQILDSSEQLLVPVPAMDAPRIAGEQVDSPLELSGVSYQHRGQESPLIRDLNLRLDAHELMAITGQSGAGKSSFIRLVIGELVPLCGEIVVLGGASGLTNRADLDGRVQMFTSEPVFKPGALLNHFGLMPTETDALLLMASRLQIAHIIHSLPDGPHFQVPIDGVIPLGRSERQRLALLRCLVTTPSILILDEALSEMAEQEEVAFVTTLYGMLDTTSFLVVTHNQQLAQRCPRQLHFTGREGSVILTINTPPV